MDDRLRDALAVVLVDLAATGTPVPRIEDKDYIELPDHVSAMLWWPAGSVEGVSIRLTGRACDQIVELAEQVQEMVIGELRTSWPACPQHPKSHPLAAAIQDSAAQWLCPTDATPAALIGALRPERI